MSESRVRNKATVLREIDPDPFSVLLVILGAVGSLVSTFAYTV